jgi:hypothetical protein
MAWRGPGHEHETSTSGGGGTDDDNHTHRGVFCIFRSKWVARTFTGAAADYSRVHARHYCSTRGGLVTYSDIPCSAHAYMHVKYYLRPFDALKNEVYKRMQF